MIPYFWIKNMVTAGLEPGEKIYEELIEHLGKWKCPFQKKLSNKIRLRFLFLRRILRSPEKRRTTTRRSAMTINQGPQERFL